MSFCYTPISALLICLPALCAQDAATCDLSAHIGSAAPELAQQPSGIDDLCAELIKQAQSIDQLLNRATDKESSDAIASELEELIKQVEVNLRKLEAYPFQNEHDAEALKSHMAVLTHVSQDNLAAMQRLSEVNAYGSTALMSVFSRYKVDAEKLPQLQAEDLPHTQLYTELADVLEDALLCLRKAKDEKSIDEAITTLQDEYLKKAEHTRDMLTQLAPLRTDEQKEAVRPARERLQQLYNELKEINARHQAEPSLNSEDLESVMLRLLQAAAG